MKEKISRRGFMRKTVAAGAVVGGFSILNSSAKGSREFKLALIGCGGRGNGALGNCLGAAKGLGVSAKVVATADWFKRKAESTGKKHGLAADKCFGGATGYRKVMESDADVVLLATSPNFRPVHFEAAIEAGKNVFMEKPVAVDPPGIRRLMDAGEAAKTKGLGVVAGTQRRHQSSYRLNAHLIHMGAIGKILNGQVYWCGRVPWTRRREQGQSDADYLVKNWVNWNIMSGDHITEQHVHNIDVANWFIGRPPVSAHGFGGRARRRTGDQFDFFSIDLDYGEGCHIHSMCRQIAGCYNRVGESFVGTEGNTSGDGKIDVKDGFEAEAPAFKGGNPYVIEHYDLLDSIIKGKPLNETENVANATLAAIMGRMSAYTGQIVRRSDCLRNQNSGFYNLALRPTAEDFEKGEVVAPKDDVVAIPGK
jgi:predicted dehydrogenase